MSTGRNDPCPCGSGKKYKQCCLGKGGPETQARTLRILIGVGVVALAALITALTVSQAAGGVVLVLGAALILLIIWMTNPPPPAGTGNDPSAIRFGG